MDKQINFSINKNLLILVSVIIGLLFITIIALSAGRRGGYSGHNGQNKMMMRPQGGEREYMMKGNQQGQYGSRIMQNPVQEGQYQVQSDATTTLPQ